MPSPKDGTLQRAVSVVRVRVLTGKPPLAIRMRTADAPCDTDTATKVQYSTISDLSPGKPIAEGRESLLLYHSTTRIIDSFSPAVRSAVLIISPGLPGSPVLPY